MHMHDFFMKISKEMLEFLSPAADFVEKRMSLDEICIMWPHATYFMSAVGQVCSVGIHDGALLVIDSSVTPVIDHADVAGAHVLLRLRLYPYRALEYVDGPYEFGGVPAIC